MLTFDAIPEKYQEKVKGYSIEYVKKGKNFAEEYEMLYKEEISGHRKASIILGRPFLLLYNDDGRREICHIVN